MSAATRAHDALGETASKVLNAVLHRTLVEGTVGPAVAIATSARVLQFRLLLLLLQLQL